jgi:hypothetical protein
MSFHGDSRLPETCGVCEFIFECSFYRNIGTVPHGGEHFFFCGLSSVGLDNIPLSKCFSGDYFGMNFFFSGTGSVSMISSWAPTQFGCRPLRLKDSGVVRVPSVAKD